MVNLSDGVGDGAGALWAMLVGLNVGEPLLLLVVGLDAGPEPSLPHHNHSHRSQENHMLVILNLSYSLQHNPLIARSCEPPPHSTKNIAPIIVSRTLLPQLFGNYPGGLPTLGKATIPTRIGNDASSPELRACAVE